MAPDWHQIKCQTAPAVAMAGQADPKRRQGHVDAAL
jgi:hypothetical protein